MAILILIFVSQRFVDYLADASVGDLSSALVLKLLSLKTINSLMIILPLSLFLAVLLSFGRLYKDHEMIVMAACGVSVRTVFKIVFRFSIVIAFIVAAISLLVAPWAEEQAYRIQDQQKNSSELSGIAAGRFTESSASDGVIYVEDLRNKGEEMINVFMQSEKGDSQSVLSSARAYESVDEDNGGRFIVMVDGYRYEGTPGERDFKMIKFKEHGIRITENTSPPTFRKLRASPTINLVKAGGVEELTELHWRISMPLSAVLLALLAVPLSRTLPRQGRYGKLFTAILVYVIYSNLMGVAQTWMERGMVPVSVGMWWVHLCVLAGILILLSRQYGAKWVTNALLGRAQG